MHSRISKITTIQAVQGFKSEERWAGNDGPTINQLVADIPMLTDSETLKRELSGAFEGVVPMVRFPPPLSLPSSVASISSSKAIRRSLAAPSSSTTSTSTETRKSANTSHSPSPPIPWVIHAVRLLREVAEERKREFGKGGLDDTARVERHEQRRTEQRLREFEERVALLKVENAELKVRARAPKSVLSRKAVTFVDEPPTRRSTRGSGAQMGDLGLVEDGIAAPGVYTSSVLYSLLRKRQGLADLPDRDKQRSDLKGAFLPTARSVPRHFLHPPQLPPALPHSYSTSESCPPRVLTRRRSKPFTPPPGSKWRKSLHASHQQLAILSSKSRPSSTSATRKPRKQGPQLPGTSTSTKRRSRHEVVRAPLVFLSGKLV